MTDFDTMTHEEFERMLDEAIKQTPAIAVFDGVDSFYIVDGDEYGKMLVEENGQPKSIRMANRRNK